MIFFLPGPEVAPSPFGAAGTVTVGGGGGGGGGNDAQFRIAVFTFKRPPLAVNPVNVERWSTEFNSTFFRPAVSSAQCDSTSAAAPATCGVAIEVPLKLE